MEFYVSEVGTFGSKTKHLKVDKIDTRRGHLPTSSPTPSSSTLSSPTPSSPILPVHLCLSIIGAYEGLVRSGKVRLG